MPNAPVVLIAYSAGALIVYKWLATRATLADVQRFAAIVCLAGPYRFFQPVQTIGFAHKPGFTIDVQEDSIDPTLIARYLRPWQLIVLLAGEDETVLPANASFQPAQIPNLIDEHVIYGAEHHTICSHAATLAYIRARLLSFADATPPLYQEKEVAGCGEQAAKP